MLSISATSTCWPRPVRARCTSAVWIAPYAKIAPSTSATNTAPGAGRSELAGIARERAVEAARGVDDHRVGGALGRRPALAVARDRAVDELRIERAHRFLAEAEPLHHAGPEVLDQHVGLADQAAHQGDRLGPLQVEREAALAGVELAEVGALAVAQRRALAHVVAFGRLDLQDLGAHVGAQPRAVGAGQHDREVEHPEAGERVAARGAGGRRHREAAARGSDADDDREAAPARRRRTARAGDAPRPGGCASGASPARRRAPAAPPGRRGAFPPASAAACRRRRPGRRRTASGSR